MIKYLFLLLTFSSAALAIGQRPATPDQLYGELFTEIQSNGLFADSKTFVDCIPKKDPAAIVKAYLAIKANPAIRFSLPLFVEENFIIPQEAEINYRSDTTATVVTHINNLWKILQRKADTPIPGSSLLPLPYPYIVPGGRFREIYYWDSYFTMLGLKVSKECTMMENMIKNFTHLIHTYGHIPNGNRSYYLSRSQPPFFAHMLSLLCEGNEQALLTYYPAVEKEYRYWMEGAASLKPGQVTKRVVRMEDGTLLNRYWDELTIPRQESYLEDVKTADIIVNNFRATALFQNAAQQKKAETERRQKAYADLRAAAASGWDFSSRWFADGKNLSTIQTTNIVPVDLNCLLILSEQLVSAHAKDPAIRKLAKENAAKRLKAIDKYFWNAELQFFTDYHFVQKAPTNHLTLAGAFPLFFTYASPQQAESVAQRIAADFLKAGGLVTSLATTGEQWDAPNGWAPLQWIAIQGLKNYEKDTLATSIANRWIKLSIDVYKRTGKLLEKYNVVDTSLKAGGGEYPNQDGFGWTNGVLLALINEYGIKE
jgi:alpha,alpha-trehalase